jgi:hypothetical protein
MQMKRILLISVLCLFVHELNAQIVTEEQPMGLTLVKITISRNINTYSDTTIKILSPPNRVIINEEDSIADKQDGPLRFA